MISHYYIEEENIIYSKWSGVITLQQIIDHNLKIDNEFKHHKVLNIIEDARNAVLDIDIEKEVRPIVEDITEGLVSYDAINTAHITSDPESVVLGMLYREQANKLRKYSFEVFSTIEAAKHWLSLRNTSG